MNLSDELGLPEVSKVEWDSVPESDLERFIGDMGYPISHGRGKVHIVPSYEPYKELFDDLTSCWCESKKLQVNMFNGIYELSMNILVVESPYNSYDLDGANILTGSNCDLNRVLGGRVTQMAAIVSIGGRKALLKGTLSNVIDIDGQGADMVVDARNFKGSIISPGKYKCRMVLGLYNQSLSSRTIGVSRLNIMGIPGAMDIARGMVSKRSALLYRSIDNPRKLLSIFSVSDTDSSPASYIQWCIYGEAKRADTSKPSLTRMLPVVQHIKTAIPNMVRRISRQPDRWKACLLAAIDTSSSGMWVRFVGDGGIILPSKLAKSMGADCDGDIIGVARVNEDEALLFRTPVMESYIPRVWLRGDVPSLPTSPLVQHVSVYADRKVREGLGKHRSRIHEPWESWPSVAARMRRAGWYTGMACNAMALAMSIGNRKASSYFASLYQAGVDDKKKEVSVSEIDTSLLASYNTVYREQYLELDYNPLVWGQKHKSVSVDVLAQEVSKVHNKTLPDQLDLKPEASYKYVGLLGSYSVSVASDVSRLKVEYAKSVGDPDEMDKVAEKGVQLYNMHGSQVLAAAHDMCFSQARSRDITVMSSFAWFVFRDLYIRELLGVYGVTLPTD